MQAKHPKAAEILEEAVEDILAHMHFPRSSSRVEDWRAIPRLYSGVPEMGDRKRGSYLGSRDGLPTVIQNDIGILLMDCYALCMTI